MLKMITRLSPSLQISHLFHSKVFYSQTHKAFSSLISNIPKKQSNSLLNYSSYSFSKHYRKKNIKDPKNLKEPNKATTKEIYSFLYPYYSTPYAKKILSLSFLLTALSKGISTSVNSSYNTI